MRSSFYKRFFGLVLLGLLSACTSSEAQASDVLATLTGTPVDLQGTPFSSTATTQPIMAFTPTVVSATPESQITPVATPVRVWHEAGKVTAPILLYHHVGEPLSSGRYNIKPEDFEAQMKSLSQMGYESILITTLIKVIWEGGELPERPFLITFDDGDEDVFQNAFPIMQKYGYTGTVYLVYKYVDAESFMDKEQILTLVNAGWEMGSHSTTHGNLASTDNIRLEMYNSKINLEQKLGIPIESFAYPFGSVDQFVMGKAKQYGYRGAVGLGSKVEQSLSKLYYLSRIEIMNETTLDQFETIFERK